MRTDRPSLKILALLLLLATLLTFASCDTKTPEPTAASTADATTAQTTTAATTEEPAKYTVRLNAPSSTSIHTELQTAYLSDRDPISYKNYLKPAYAAQSVSYDDKPGTLEFGRPATITLTWDVETELPESNVRAFSIRIWRADAPRKVISKTLPKTTKEYVFSNLMIGETYCWTVAVIDSENKSYPSETGRFKTDAEGPRNLTVDGVTNVRDLGGWATEDGGRVRQGLLFRGSKLVQNNSKTKLIVTEAGIKTMCNELGIKSEIDLRLTSKLGGLTSSPLGSTVTFYSCPMDDNAALFFTEENNMKSIRDVFAVLADEKNYPVYFHCSIGTDRTGLIAWLVNGLCGVTENDLWRDYVFSNFGVINGKRSTGIKGDYVDKLKTAQGNSFAEQIYNYLKDTVRVPEADLQAVIRIMKEPAASRP
ncbi:MAG: tyrosine-protein phosphatase [Clostridia bacterium]|nr:tyrosine-protein phosphatase [Clostridia bacterium]